MFKRSKTAKASSENGSASSGSEVDADGVPAPRAPATRPSPKPLKTSEVKDLAKLAKRMIFGTNEQRRALQGEGVNIIPANFYSEVPTLDELDDAFEYRETTPFDLPFLDPDKVAAAYDALVPYAQDFNPPLEDPGDELAFYWRNPAFSYCDAMVYYAMIRRERPAHILEFGSGYSSRVAAEALKANGEGKLSCLEPFPMEWLRRLDCNLIEKKAQDLTAEALNDMLADGDILFIDSTHTVKFGSDCLHIYLRLLPKLRRKLMVHVHDIYLPFGMPLEGAQRRHIYWTEQYLLHAFMLFNDRCEFELGNVYGRRFTPEAQKRLMHGRYPNAGASWWFKWLGSDWK